MHRCMFQLTCHPTVAAILDGAMGDGHIPSFEESCNVLPYWTVEVAPANAWAGAEDEDDADEDD